jgi:hypothetical protein
MQPDPSTTRSKAPPESDPAAGGSRHLATGVTTRPSHLLLWALAASLLAGIAAWLGGEATYRPFRRVHVQPPNWDKMGPYDKRDYVGLEELVQIPPAETKNAALAYGVLGAALAGALGLAAGLARRSVSAGLAAGLLGIVVGAAAGAAMATVMVPIFYRHHSTEPGPMLMLLPLLARAGIWVPIGVAAGLALGLGLGDHRRIPGALIGGLLGATVGTIAFEVINAIAYPLVRTTNVVPVDKIPRLLTHICVAIFTAFLLVMAVREGRKRSGARTAGA